MARNCQYSEYWDKSHYNVDIDEDVSRSGTYIDRCVNTINIEKVDNKPTGGYKQYRHSFNNHKVQIANIRHKNQNQDGFDEIKNKTYIEVSVFYFEFDIGNDLPLLVKLTKSNTTHEYYKKVDYFVTSSSWKTDLDVKEESQLSPKLTEIIRSLNNVIVLKIDKVTNGTYYANGTEKPPDANQTTQVQVIHSTYETVYKKYLHKLPYKKLRLLSTKTRDKNIPFESPVYGTEYREASVYFWEGDDSRANPLLLELKPASNTPSYYILSGEGIGKKWTKDSNTPSTLKEKLDKQNCERNQAHTIDISKKSSSSSNNYDCPSCVSTPAMISITSSSIDQANVIKYSHKVIIGSIGKFVCKGKTQRGIDITANIKTATVYWYPEIGTLIPLVISYSSKFYRRINTNEWVEEESLKTDNDYSRMKELLQKTYSEFMANNKDPLTEDNPSHNEKHSEHGSWEVPGEKGNLERYTPVVITSGVIVGIALTCLIYECLVLRMNPGLSATRRIMSFYTRFR